MASTIKNINNGLTIGFDRKYFSNIPLFTVAQAHHGSYQCVLFKSNCANNKLNFESNKDFVN